MRDITLEQVEHIFRTTNGKRVALLEERVKVIRVKLENLWPHYFRTLVEFCSRSLVGISVMP